MAAPSPPLQPWDDVVYERALSRANHGTGCWEEGWRVERVLLDGLLIERAGLRLHAGYEVCQPAALEAAEGSTVRLRGPKEWPRRSPGYFLVGGDAGQPSGSDLVRLYWNLTPAGAIRILDRLTTLLNRARIPFFFKVLRNPMSFS